MLRPLLILKRWRSFYAKRQIDRLGNHVQMYGIVDKRGGGQISIGDQSIVEGVLVCNQANSVISIGNRTFIGPGTTLDCLESITIGDDVLVAYQTIFSDHDSHSLYWHERQHDVLDWHLGAEHKRWDVVKRSPIVIGRKSWIGARSIFLKGVHLGEGCVVAAGSVVTKSFPANSLVAGNPAKLIRTIQQNLID